MTRPRLDGSVPRNPGAIETKVIGGKAGVEEAVMSFLKNGASGSGAYVCSITDGSNPANAGPFLELLVKLKQGNPGFATQ